MGGSKELSVLFYAMQEHLEASVLYEGYTEHLEPNVPYSFLIWDS